MLMKEEYELNKNLKNTKTGGKMSELHEEIESIKAIINDHKRDIKVGENMLNVKGKRR